MAKAKFKMTYVFGDGDLGSVLSISGDANPEVLMNLLVYTARQMNMIETPKDELEAIAATEPKS